MKKILSNIYEFILLILIGFLFIIDFCIKKILGYNKGIFKTPETDNPMDIYEINNL